MSWTQLTHLYRQLLHRQKVEVDLDDEVRAYFELLIDRGVEKGLTREQARRAVRLLKSTGYYDAQRIVQLWEKPPEGGRNVISGADYLDWNRQSHSFASMAAWTGTSMSYSGGSEPVSLRTQVVSAPYFDVFGTRAALGRTFTRDEDQPGKNRVVVLSHHLWLNHFGGDARIIGRPIVLNRENYTVIGVLPGTSAFDRGWAEIWLPLTIPPHAARDYHYLLAAARLKPGVSIAQAQGEMSAIAGSIAEMYPAVKKTGEPSWIDISIV